MVKFKRGIENQEFIDSLNTLYADEKSFWHKMVNDKDLFIAIRNEYLNVYFNGQSICRLEYSKGIIKGHTHKKYLGVNEHGYFVSKNGNISNKKSLIANLDQLEDIKTNVSKYIGKEKLSSYNEVHDKDMHVIDVEITFIKEKISNPKKNSDYERSSIDYLAFEDDTLVFYEAKHFSNSEIRSRTEPKVFNQIRRYEEELKIHKSEVIDSYNAVLQNLRDFKISPDLVIPSNLKIDLKPKLIVFAVNKNEIDDKHLQRLRNQFGSRLKLKN